jgi:hypothetical protein
MVLHNLHGQSRAEKFKFRRAAGGQGRGGQALLVLHPDSICGKTNRAVFVDRKPRVKTQTCGHGPVRKIVKIQLKVRAMLAQADVLCADISKWPVGVCGVLVLLLGTVGVQLAR